MWAMISIRITTTADGTPIFTMVWDGVLIIIPGTTHGMILGIMDIVAGMDGVAHGTIADGNLPGIMVGITPGITADGIRPGITADGIRPGIMAAGTIPGITEVIGADMEVVTTMDFMMDITAA